MNKNEVLKILETAKDKNGEVPMRLVRQAFEKLPEPCEDAVSRKAAIDARRYTFGNDEFSLEAAYHDCQLVFDGITDDDSFQDADTGLILYYANEIIYALQAALEGKDTKQPESSRS